MSKGRSKNQNNEKSQLELFDAANIPQPPHSVSEPQASKVISLADHKHQQDIKKFYDAVNKMTSHLK